jgi:hypothetical protein
MWGQNIGYLAYVREHADRETRQPYVNIVRMLVQKVVIGPSLWSSFASRCLSDLSGQLGFSWLYENSLSAYRAQKSPGHFCEGFLC